MITNFFNLINENDEIAKDILKRKYAPLIYEKSKEYYQRNHYDIPSFSFDELINLGNSVLLRATKTYNEKENALFYTYFITCLAREFSLYKRGLLAKKNKYFIVFPTMLILMKLMIILKKRLSGRMIRVKFVKKMNCLSLLNNICISLKDMIEKYLN